MTNLDLAKQIYVSGTYTFVLVKHGQVIATGTRDGVGELLDAVTQLGDTLRGASLADKIVGKAVAMIAAYAGIVEIYTPLASETAQEILNQYNLRLYAERLVPLIRNKRNDGPCPMERLTLPLTEPGAAVAALKEFVAQKRAPIPS